MKMKIAYILGEFPSLSETFLAREIEALRRRGLEIEVWALRAGEGALQIPELSALQCLAKIAGKVSALARRKYFHLLGKHWAESSTKELQDVQHIHAGWASFASWIAMGAAEALNVPWSFSGHARDLWVQGEDLETKLTRAKFATCCTRDGTEYLQKFAGSNSTKVLYAPHGLEIDQYHFLTSRRLHDPNRVLSVGRLVEKKGFADLVQSVSKIRDRSLAVTIIGEGPQRRALEELISPSNLREKIQLMGARTHGEVSAAMQDADVFVMPSTLARDGDRDGLPNVLLEAAACGLPIVSTRAGSITDFLDERCAWLCEANDHTALSLTIETALAHYDESLKRAKLARSRVEECFDIDRNITILANAFTQ